MKKILIIDDEKNFREALANILTLNGYFVIVAENENEGINKCVNENPDLVLCDVKMPEMNGFEVLRTIKIKVDEKSESMPPFIFLTAKIEKEDIQHGMKLGAVDYITKPFTAKKLLDAIRSRLLKVSGLK